MPDDSTTRPTDGPATDTAPTQTVPDGRGRGSVTLPQREPGDTIGRYEVVQPVAQGGMGVVYEAYDPELDRRIALKLLKSRLDGETKRAERRERMLREAQALAQLSHPNVISVYDAGVVDGDVFIAMELVKGASLSVWLEQPRSQAEILDVIIRAGEGLAAAHDAGLVHRDVKPSNIIVGDDGRVRIIDFGLARTSDTLEVGAARDKREAISPPSGSGENWLDTTLTRAGAIMGTPRYMAPEQHEGKPLDHLSDQYSYAATLYRALYGVCPIENDDYKQLRRAAIAGELDQPPSTANVNAHVVQVMLRALSRDPADRYPSLRDMIGDLQRDPYARLRRLALGLAVLAIAALVAFSLFPAPNKKATCPAADATIDGVWDDGAKQALRTGFDRSGRSYQADTFTLLTTRLDGYARRISEMRRASCVATRIDQRQSDELFDLRSDCLHRREQRLHALVTILANAPSAKVVDRATLAADALPPVAQCADAKALRAVVPMPAETERRAAIEHLRALDASARTQLTLAAYKRGLELLQPVEQRARDVKYPPVEARLLLTLADLYAQTAKWQRAMKLYEAALVAAGRAKEPQFLAFVWIRYVEIIGINRAKYDEALTLSRAARVAVAQAGDTPLLRARLDSAVGAILAAKGKYDQAVTKLREAEAIQRKLADKNDDAHLTTIDRLASAVRAQGHYTEAAGLMKQLIARYAQKHGDRHHTVAAAIYNLASIYSSAGRYDEAWKHLTRARALLDKILGPDDPRRAMMLTAAADILKQQHKLDEARELLEQALAIRRRSKVATKQGLAFTLQSLGDVLVAQKKYVEARRYLEEALALRRKYLPANHNHIGESLAAIAGMLWDQKKLAEASKYYTQTLAIYKVTYGPKHPFYAIMLLNLGELALEQKQYREAIDRLERAVAVLKSHTGTPARLADARFVLARALWASGNKQRARQQAQLAHDGYRQAKSTVYKKYIRRTKKWLDEHR